jgi:hypothetical protein
VCIDHERVCDWLPVPSERSLHARKQARRFFSPQPARAETQKRRFSGRPGRRGRGSHWHCNQSRSMYLPGTCLLISSPERSQMSVSSEPSKAARKLLCPSLPLPVCVLLALCLWRWIAAVSIVAVHVMMQVRWKSGALWPVHPESLPWNPRLSCRAAPLRSALFSWRQVLPFLLW